MHLVHAEGFDAFYAREYASLVALALVLTGSRTHAEEWRRKRCSRRIGAGTK